MNANLKIITLVLSSVISWKSFAVNHPQITKPIELESGEFSEGTITQLSKDDVAKFLPWANNAKKVLDDALAESKRLPLNEKAPFLEAEIKRVVRGSGAKSYQMFMRFALNRGLLLFKILNEEADINDEGIVQNQITILTSSIELAKKHYESDLAFQNNSEVRLNYAVFAEDMGKAYLPLSLNIFDVSAQYKILYKTLEMINWDFSQDEKSADEGLAEKIVDIYRTLERLPKTLKEEEKLYTHIQGLYYIVQKLELAHLVPVDVISQDFDTIPCGLSGSIEDRIKDCSNQPKSVSGGFVLVSKDNDFSNTSIWRNKLTGLLWTDTVESYAGHDNSSEICNSADKKEFMGLDLIVQWRKPTVKEFKDAFKNGLWIYPTTYWTSSYFFDHNWTFEFNLDNTYETTISRNRGVNAVRCVGSVIVNE